MQKLVAVPNGTAAYVAVPFVIVPNFLTAASKLDPCPSV